MGVSVTIPGLVCIYKLGGLIGCDTSHRHITRITLDRGARNMLIFEDDARPDLLHPHYVVYNMR